MAMPFDKYLHVLLVNRPLKQLWLKEPHQIIPCITHFQYSIKECELNYSNKSAKYCTNVCHFVQLAGQLANMGFILSNQIYSRRPGPPEDLDLPALPG